MAVPASPTLTRTETLPLLRSHVSWGAILAGATVALTTQVVLNLLGVGIGTSTIDPTTTAGTPGAAALSIGAATWWIGAGIVSAFFGAYVAGRLSGRLRDEGALHGLTTWAVTTLVVLYLLTSAVGGVIGGAFGLVGGAIGGLGNAAGGAARTAAETAAPSIAGANDPFGRIEQSVRSASAGQDPAAARDAAVSALRAAVTGDESQAAAARDRAAQALATAQGIPVDQARTQVTQYEQQYRQTVERAKQQAAVAADATAKTVSRGAFLAFAALVLGAAASWFGGRLGAGRVRGAL